MYNIDKNDDKKGKFTLNKFLSCKEKDEKIPMMTCYDYPHSKLLRDAGIEVILVGDSLGMVVLGYENTLHVTVDDMIRHAAAVRRGSPDAFIVVDMPYMSYEISTEDTLRNAKRLILEGGGDAVKIEGGKNFRDRLKALNAAKIPVVGHVGLTPQSVNILGGYKPKGRTEREVADIVDDVSVLIECGAVGIVLECIPEEAARILTESIPVPTIGIGSGKFCDGQVLVSYDILGLYEKKTKKFVKKYTDLSNKILKAYSEYADDVVNRRFPDREHCYGIDEEMIETVKREICKIDFNKKDR